VRGPLAGVLALIAAMVGGCGSPQAPGRLPQAPPPQIACGSSIVIDGVSELSQAVSYPAPAVTGGAAPVNVTCTPPSGSTFPLGETTVTCAAVDALARQATCSFVVTRRHRELAVTTVLAFGDSITEGENGRPVNFRTFIDLPNAYPTVLQQYFVERLPGQEITVINAGRGGERVTENDERLKARIAAHRPQVLLLLEGTNDVAGELPASAIAGAIRDSIRTARDREVEYVFVGTIPPTAPDNCLPQPAVPRCRGNDLSDDLLQETNQLIRALVPAAGAHLVDFYDHFVNNRTSFIDIDGLHLTPEGNRALASAFWERMVAVIPARQLGIR
jgi:lysophospholipase L1-like esterase